jgi:hypothetical protein
VTAGLPYHRPAPEEQHHQQGKDDPRNGVPSGGTHGERLVETAVTDATPAADTFRREHTLFMHDIDVGRADLAADAAGDAALGIAGDADRRQHRQQPQQGAVGTEVAAEGVFERQREEQERQDHPQRQGREVQEKIQQAHIGQFVIVRVDEGLQRPGRHGDGDGPDEESHQQILYPAQEYIQPARQARVAPKQLETGLPGTFRDSRHRADPGTERAPEEQRHHQHRQKDHHRCRVDDVEAVPLEPGGCPQETRDGQKALDTVGAGHKWCRIATADIVDELVEPDTQPEHEAEEAELDQDAERLDIAGRHRGSVEMTVQGRTAARPCGAGYSAFMAT